MEWISVKDRLPEKTEPMMFWDDETDELVVGIENYKATVLAYNEDLGIFKAVFNKLGWSEVSSISNRGCLPTHWMPLPEKPE